MDLKFYPPRLWGLDCLFNTPIKLNICDILQLPDYPNYLSVYCLLNHPVSKVCIMGDVRIVERKEKFISYYIDDGTGCIKCTYWRQMDQDEPNIQSSELVRITGTIDEFNGRRTIRVTVIAKEVDPNAEILHWLQMIKLKQTVYNKPFILPPSYSQQQQSSLIKSIMDKLLQYLNESVTDTIVLDHLEKEMCEKGIISSICSDSLNPKQELHDAIVMLTADGYLVHTEREGHYKFIPDSIISKAVSGIFNKYKDRKVSSSLSIEQIHRELTTGNTELHQLTIKRTENIIDLLVDENIIYPIQERKYRLI